MTEAFEPKEPKPVTSGQVSGELLIIAETIHAEARRIMSLAKSEDHSERQKAIIAISLIASIPFKAELGGLASAACYEELKRVV